MRGAREVVDTFAAAFSEPDPVNRGRLLEPCFAEDGLFVSSPTGVVRGRLALNAALQDFHARMPGVHVVRTSGVDEQHRRLRFRWGVLGPEGGVMFDRLDLVGELDDSSRISRMTAFFGPLPPRE